MIRKNGPLIAAFLFSSVLPSFIHASEPDPNRLIQRIAFGSCARQTEPQRFWDTILEAGPDLFIFAGDNVYADTDDETELRDSYARLGAIRNYQAFARAIPMIAIWDDHDFGLNDGGGDFPFKDTSKKVFMDFFAVPENDERRKRPGLYTSFLLGPPGKTVQLIVLDTRYFRSPLKEIPGEERRYLPDEDPEKTILGERQWEWLEGELKKPADLRFIVSSIQVIAKDHPFEKWGNLPLEREKFFEVLRRTRAKRVILLTGDRHFAELSVLQNELEYPLYDLTSSSLNAPANVLAPEPNPHRLAIVLRTPNYGWIDIDWSRAAPRVKLQIRDTQGGARIRRTIPFSEIQ